MLVKEGGYLTIFIPPTSRALIFRVIGIKNKGYEKFDYGPLPISSGTVLPTYDGGSVTVPEDGVLPARSYTLEAIRFPLEGAYEPSDMWYLPSREKETLFHVHQYVKPAFLRIDVQIPKDITQASFQGRVTGGIDKDFGFKRGYFETIHIPGIVYGYRYGNDTNLDVRTFVMFIYGEYHIELVKDPELVFDILIGRVHSYWYTMPIRSYDDRIRIALIDAYGFEGYPLPKSLRRELEIKTYSEIVRGIKA